MNLQTQQTKQNDLGLTTTSQRCFASMSAGQPDHQHQRQMKGKRTMGHNIFLFIYIIAGLAGLITMFIISLAKYSASGNRELLSKIGRFVLCTAFIDILYLYIEYRWSISGQPSPSAHPIIRTADILLYIGQMYCWCSYIREKCRLDKDKTFIPPYISAASAENIFVTCTESSQNYNTGNFSFYYHKRYLEYDSCHHDDIGHVFCRQYCKH